MKIELNKTYLTKRGIPVKITMQTSWGFFGTLQDDSKRSVKYNENGKVPGWFSGNMLNIKGSDEEDAPEPNEALKTAAERYKKKYEAIQAKKEEIAKEAEEVQTPEDGQLDQN